MYFHESRIRKNKLNIIRKYYSDIIKNNNTILTLTKELEHGIITNNYYLYDIISDEMIKLTCNFGILNIYITFN